MSNKNVYILGAGFSNPLGIPSVSDFYQTIREIHLDKKSMLNDYLSKCFDGVTKYRSGLSTVSERTMIDLNDIETLFSYLDMDCKCGSGTPKDMRRMLIYTIINTLDLSTNLQKKDEALRWLPINAYKYFIHLVSGIIGDRKSEDVIITFNYDLILDKIFLDSGITVDYCYENTSNGGIKYLKLHGSADWLLCKKCKKIKNYKNYPKDVIKCEKCGSILEPLIVPPTWNKTEYRSKINRIWKVAIKELKEARRIFIIGYSMPPTDLYFEYLMSLGLKDNNFVDKIIVIDREKPSIEGTQKASIEKHLKELDDKYHDLLNKNFVKHCYEFRSDGVLKFITTNLSDDIDVKISEDIRGKYFGPESKVSAGSEHI